MRKIVYFVHTTLDGRISDAEGAFWDPFPWGQEEMEYNNDFFRTADTWVLGRRMYEAVIPWWDLVADGRVPDDVVGLTPQDEEFARLQRGLTKVVLSTTLTSTQGSTVVSEDPIAELWRLKKQEGKSVLLSVGPALFALAASEPNLIDEVLLVLHPTVLGNGPSLYRDLRQPLSLRLVEATSFAAGAVVLRYAPSWLGGHAGA